jgi:pimeloyl-ACP methyl ester carboxylesterase
MQPIDVPILFLSGEQDELVPPQMMQQLYQVRLLDPKMNDVR